MTIPVISSIPPLVPPATPIPNVTPFTYRDGISFVQRLDRLAKYINKTLVPWVEGTVNDLNAVWVTTVTEIVSAVETAVAEIGTSVEDAEAARTGAEVAQAAAEAAQAAAEAAAAAAASANDAAITALFNNLSSAFRQALDDQYAEKTAFETLQASVTSLTGTVGLKANQTDLDTTNTNLGNLTTVVGTKASAASVATLETEVDNKTDIEEVIAVERRGRYDVDYFQYLRNGAVNLSQDTRVVVLGSSTARGANAPYALNSEGGQGVFQRLAGMCGVILDENLDAIAAPVTPNGMKWWTGATSATKVSNYVPSGRITAINHVDPHYVFHMIGSNDYADQTNINTFKTTLDGVCDQIEANTPGVINVIIAMQGRRDDLARPISWASYRTAMREVAELNTVNRRFIDVYDGMEMFGTESDNRAGLVTTDNIHMGSLGHAYLFQQLSGMIGLPTPQYFANWRDVRPFVFPAGATHSVDADLTEVIVPAANYPRLVEVRGAWFTTPSTTTAETNIRMVKVSDSSIIETTTLRMGAAIAATRIIAAEFILPAFAAYKFVIRVAVGGGTVIVSANTAAFNKAKLIISPM